MWKDIEESNGLLEVSEEGVVRKKSTREVLTQHDNGGRLSPCHLA